MSEINPNLLTPKGILVGAVVGTIPAALEANRHAAEKAAAFVNGQPIPRKENRRINPNIPITEKGGKDEKDKPAPRTQLQSIAFGDQTPAPRVEQIKGINFTPLPKIMRPAPVRKM